MKTPRNKMHIQLWSGRWRIFGPSGKPSHEARTKLFVRKLNSEITRKIRNELKNAFFPNSDYRKKAK